MESENINLVPINAAKWQMNNVSDVVINLAEYLLMDNLFGEKFSERNRKRKEITQ